MPTTLGKSTNYQHLYGSSRLGMIHPGVKRYPGDGLNDTIPYYIQHKEQPYGARRYEITNHLGNVTTILSDRKMPEEQGGDMIYKAVVHSAVDYYPFGMIMPGRSFNSNSYRYGHGGQEKDDEIAGSGNSYTAMFWQYDPRLGRRWNRDPITYPWNSSYVVFNDNPIAFNDPLGLFGSRKEARTYKKEHDLKGRIHKDDDGIFSIDHKKSGTSYFKDASMDNIPDLIGRQEDGVIKAALVTPDETPSPSTGHYMAGIGEFGTRGEKLTKTTTLLKSTGKVRYYDNNWGGNQYVKTNKVFSKGLTKVAKKAPLIGHVMTASEIIDGIQADGNAIGANTATEVAGAIGGAGGGWAGAAAGAAIGSMIFPGVGTVVGGVVGGVLGSWGGEAGAEYGTKAILNE